VRLPLTAAAAWACCSRRYVERFLKRYKDAKTDLDWRPDGTIDARNLAGVVQHFANKKRRGRRFGTRYLFQLPPYRKTPDDSWRMNRILAHIGKLRDPKMLDIIILISEKQLAARGGNTPAGLPKT